MQHCDICGKSFANRQNLNRHRKKVHCLKRNETEIICGLCNFSSKSLLQIKTHLSTAHEGKPFRVCVYCKKIFVDESDFNHHLQNEHTLPILQRNDPSTNLESKSAFKNLFKIFQVDGDGSIDFVQFMLQKEQDIRQVLLESAQNSPMKVQLSASIRLTKPVEESPESIEIHLNTDMIKVFADGLSTEEYFQMIDKMLASLFSFTAHGSGWALEKINHLDVKMAKFRPVRGSSYIALPGELQGLRSLLNIRNQYDNRCFLYCFTAAYHLHYGPPLKPDTWRTVTSPTLYSSNNPSARQAEGSYEMPMGFRDLPNFEKENSVQVNVFRYEKKQLFPLRVSQRSDIDFRMDLLLLQDDNVYHYVLIKNLLNLVNHIKQRRPRTSDIICRNCFHVCTLINFDKHMATCLKNEPAVIEMPSENKNKVYFKNFRACVKAPVVIYFDLESLIVPVNRDQTSTDKTRVLEKHEPCGFCFAIIEQGSLQPTHLSIDRSESCMKKLAQRLQAVAKEIYHKKQSHRVFQGPPPYGSDQATECWICSSAFVDGTKVLDHCHYSGIFLGYAHNQCSLKRRTINYVPVIAHNSSNYDIHHLCKNLHEFDSECKIEIIPLTDEKYVTLSIGVKVNSFTDKRGVSKNVYEYLRFIDSYRFLPSSLDKLVSYLPSESFKILDNYFNEYQPFEQELLHQKGHYPYNYFNSFNKFAESELPPKNFWTNSLRGYQTSVTEKDYAHAQKVFATFRCQCLGDYHDLYLKCDTLLLACVMEEFRKLCYETYGLDPVHYFTSSHLSGDAFIKTCNAEIELLTDREHLEMTENMIRGGVASIFSKRLFTANNQYQKTFKPSEESTFGFLVDANNLYGGVMEKLPLPLKDFRKVDVSLNQILNTPIDSNVGYILEVDLDYPDVLHDIQKDFPLAPTKENIEESFLSDYQLNILERMGLKKTKQHKLLQTLNNKTNYTVHYLNLKLYVELGMVVKKVHRILQFAQSTWLKPYIVKNTLKRQQSTNKFQESFFKLMNNSCYGKTLESKRNRVNVHLVRTAQEAQKLVDTSLMKTFKIFDENLAAVTMKKPRIFWNKPTIVGACVLELSKFHMYSFHYKVMKPTFDCQLIYSDTDSLLYEIKHEDLYRELESNTDLKKHFDFSNYPKEHALYDESNKMVTLLFKDEMGGKILEEFVGLKPKMYSIKFDDGKQKLSAKGVTRFAQTSLKHEVYKTVLSTANLARTDNIRIGSHKHQLETIISNKISLSAFDDKRFIQEDGIQTLPFGHYLIRDIAAFRKIFANPKWGEEDASECPEWDTSIREHQPVRLDVCSKRKSSESRGLRRNEVHDEKLAQLLNDAWSPPDPGFHQDEYTESDLDEGNVEMLAEKMGDHISDVYATYSEGNFTRVRNPYINDEAEEEEDDDDDDVISIESEQVAPSRKRRRVNNLSSDDEDLE